MLYLTMLNRFLSHYHHWLRAYSTCDLLSELYVGQIFVRCYNHQAVFVLTLYSFIVVYCLDLLNHAVNFLFTGIYVSTVVVF